MQRIILHLDMNSYFASVEQQANPLLRGKPVGVCAYLSDNGTIIASSIEAKKLGIKTAFKVLEAKKLCPDLVLVENDPNKYRTVTQKLFNIMTEYSSDFEPYSIDEAFLDLTGMVNNFIKAGEIAAEIRQRIKLEIGEWLKCSIGISYTKFLAKFCSDAAGPNQTKIHQPSDSFDQLYQNCKLTDAWGIGFRIEKRLNVLGIYSLLDLKNYHPQNLIQVFGKQGYYLWAKLNGIEIEHLKDQKELAIKSIGHSYCLPKKTTDKKYLSSVLYKLTAKTGKRLRERNQIALGAYIHWSYVSGLVFGKRFKLKSPVCSTEDIFRLTSQVLNNVGLKNKVAMLAAGVFNLGLPSNQLGLFKQKQDHQLIEAVDNINSRYGDQLIYRGTMWKTQKYANDRIGFRKLDGLDY